MDMDSPTILAGLSKHTLYVTCIRCGRTGEVRVASLLPGREDWTLDRARAAMRCSVCGGKEAGVSIVYSGAEGNPLATWGMKPPG